MGQREKGTKDGMSPNCVRIGNLITDETRSLVGSFPPISVVHPLIGKGEYLCPLYLRLEGIDILSRVDGSRLRFCLEWFLGSGIGLSGSVPVPRLLYYEP